MHLLLLHLSCSIPGSGYFFLILCVSMCLLYVCGAVWWGSSLSLSLWIVAGMLVVSQDSRAVGEGQWPDCNCRYAEGLELEEAITGLPTAISLHTLTYPAALNHHASYVDIRFYYRSVMSADMTQRCISTS
jgi:hypothetical protein